MTGRRAPGRPPHGWLNRLVVLLQRRPELAGVGVAYLAEAVVTDV